MAIKLQIDLWNKNIQNDPYEYFKINSFNFVEGGGTLFNNKKNKYNKLEQNETTINEETIDSYQVFI